MYVITKSVENVVWMMLYQKHSSTLTEHCVLAISELLSMTNATVSGVTIALLLCKTQGCHVIITHLLYIIGCLMTLGRQVYWQRLLGLLVEENNGKVLQYIIEQGVVQVCRDVRFRLLAKGTRVALAN